MSKGFGYELKLPEGAILTKVHLSGEISAQISGDLTTLKNPNYYLRQFLADDVLFDSLQDQFDQRMHESLPQDLNCAFCKGESDKDEHKACHPFHLQMNFTYMRAAYEFLNILHRNQHHFQNRDSMKRLTIHFLDSFSFIHGKGIVWFDLPKLVKLILQEGFAALSEQFEKSDLLTNLSTINDTVDVLNDKILNQQLHDQKDVNHYGLQKQFFEGKRNYYATKLALDKAQLKAKLTSRKNTAAQIALFAFYCSRIGFKITEAPLPSLAAWKELGERYDRNYKNIQLNYNKFLHQNNRVTASNAANIEFVIERMLKDNPEATRLAEDELIIARLKK